MPDSRDWLKVGVPGAALVLVALASLVFVLASQNRGLKSELGLIQQRERLNLPYPGLLVPTFVTQTVADAGTAAPDSVLIGESRDGGAQVLFLFRSTCPHCMRTLPYWNGIVRRIEDQGLDPVRVYGLSKEPEADIRRFAEEHELSFPVGRFPDEKLADLYRLVGVPITLVLDPSGVITYARLGALTTDAAADSVVQAVRRTLEVE